MKHDIRIERHLPYPPATVWRALTDAPTLGQWFMPNDFRPAAGQEFTFQMKPQRGWDGTTHCQVTALEPMHHIAMTYRGRASGEKTLACAGIDSRGSRIGDTAAKSIFTELDTVLSFTITPDTQCNGSEHTDLVMTHTGFDGLQLTVVGLVMDMGWRRVLGRLEPVLAQLAELNASGPLAAGSAQGV